MKRYVLAYYVLVISAVAGAAYAQGCPAGTYPWSGNGVFTCLPDPNYNQQQESPQGNSARPVRGWESRWGAIATDEPHGIVGSARNASSEKAAKRVAMDDCKSKGGTTCTLQISYSNGCGVLIVGDNSFNLNAGGTEALAIQKAMDVCKAGDTGCHVHFTSCSQAVLSK